MGVDGEEGYMVRRESHQVWRVNSREGSEVIIKEFSEVSVSRSWYEEMDGWVVVVMRELTGGWRSR